MILYHVTGALGECCVLWSIFHSRVMASAVLNGVNPARGAPFFSASVGREPAQNFSDDNVILHRDANVEVITRMQWLPFLNS